MSKRRFVNWNIPVSISLDQAVEQAVKEGSFLTKSELIRTSVRNQLEKKRSQQP